MSINQYDFTKTMKCSLMKTDYFKLIILFYQDRASTNTLLCFYSKSGVKLMDLQKFNKFKIEAMTFL